jgi:hypothetical protein
MGYAQILQFVISLILTNSSSLIEVATKIKERMEAGEPIMQDDLAAQMANNEEGKRLLQEAIDSAPPD